MHVAFLDVVEGAAGVPVNGVCVPVAAEEWAAFRHSSALDTLPVEDLERVDL